MKKLLVGFIMDGKSGGIDKYLLNFLTKVSNEEVRIDFLTNEIDVELQTELKKWNPITKKPDGETVIKISYIVISKGTNHSFEIEHKTAELL